MSHYKTHIHWLQGITFHNFFFFCVKHHCSELEQSRLSWWDEIAFVTPSFRSDQFCLFLKLFSLLVTDLTIATFCHSLLSFFFYCGPCWCVHCAHLQVSCDLQRGNWVQLCACTVFKKWLLFDVWHLRLLAHKYFYS